MLLNFFGRISAFSFLNVTQFFGALNDNLYKMLMVYFFIQLEGKENSHQILASIGAIFVIPFLLFSALAGTLADRYSKRNIIAITRIIEVVIMAFGVYAFASESQWGCRITLFLLATLSAIFGPSKYGIVPELVPSDKISKANGWMTSSTFLGIILGNFLAPFLMHTTTRNFISCSLFCAVIAILGAFSSICIKYTPPSGSKKEFKWFFLAEIYHTLKAARQHVSLLPAMLGAAFFFFIGSFTQLNIIPFGMQSLGLSDIQSGYLFFLTALGIGIGSVIAGKVSGRIVELGLVPFGALGIAISALCLDIFSSHLYFVILAVIFLGIFGGIFEIPLDAYVQVASPAQTRGQMLAATNFISFVGVLLSSGLLYLNANVLHLPADKGFTVISVVTTLICIAFTFQFFDYVTRFVAMMLSSLHFRTVWLGRENIPDCPAVYVCKHTAWNDTLLLLGSQRRRMRFFIEHEQNHSSWMRKLYRLLRVVFIPDIEPLEHNSACLDAIENTLKKGISVCIFIESWDIYNEVEKLHQSNPFNQIIAQGNYPIIPVRIEKGTKHPATHVFKRIVKKYRIPASVSFGNVIYMGQTPLLKLRHEHELCLD